MKGDNTFAWVLFGIGGAVLAYAFMQGNNQSNTPTQVNPNQTLQGNGWQWQNTTGQPVWVTATGLILNSAGQLIQDISSIINAVNAGNNSASGSGVTGWYGGGLL